MDGYEYPGLIIGGIVLVLIVRLARRAQYVTIMDFCRHRYGTAMSVMGTVAQIISWRLPPS